MSVFLVLAVPVGVVLAPFVYAARYALTNHPRLVRRVQAYTADGRR